MYQNGLFDKFIGKKKKPPKGKAGKDDPNELVDIGIGGKGLKKEPEPVKDPGEGPWRPA